MEQVVELQVAGQPQQEQILSGAFQQLDAKISHVASMAKKLDGTQVSVGAFASVPFTQAMNLDMKALREEFALVKNTLNDLPAHTSAEIIRVCQPLEARIAAEGATGIAALECIAALESKTVMIESAVMSLQAAPPGFAPTCGVCSPGPSSASPWGHSPTVVSGTPGQPGSSRAIDPLSVTRACIGGNDICHCIHVRELIGRVDMVEVVNDE